MNKDPSVLLLEHHLKALKLPSFLRDYAKVDEDVLGIYRQWFRSFYGLGSKDVPALIVSLTIVALVAATTINVVWSTGGGIGPDLSLVGSISAGLVTWVWVGSTVLLLSALMDRGEALVGALLVAIPIAMTAVLPTTDLLARAARVLPVRPMLRAVRVSLAGNIPEQPALLTTGCWGVVVLGIGLFVACRRDWRAGD